MQQKRDKGFFKEDDKDKTWDENEEHLDLWGKEKFFDRWWMVLSRIAWCLEQASEDNEIENEYSIPIVNKRIALTPISLIGESCDNVDYVYLAQMIDKAGAEVGVDFIGGFSALVHKGMTNGDINLINSIPSALACTERVCSSVSVASTKAGINMDAVALMGRIIKKTAQMTASEHGTRLEQNSYLL